MAIGREQRMRGFAQAKAIEISMSRKCNPWDNAACESFIKNTPRQAFLRFRKRWYTDYPSMVRQLERDLLETLAFTAFRNRSEESYAPRT
jgi:transposase InsO family protein